MSSSAAILKRLDRNCGRDHSHVIRFGKDRTQAAAIYPQGLCRAVCRGIKSQMELDKADQFMMEVDGSLDSVQVAELWADESASAKQCWDDASGEVLDPHLVQEARADSVEGIVAGARKKVLAVLVFAVGDGEVAGLRGRRRARQARARQYATTPLEEEARDARCRT